MNAIADYPLAHALGWTLLHFCWQGAAVALLLACVLGAIGTRSSRARYAAGCIAMAVMVVLPLATFIRLVVQDYRLAALRHTRVVAADLYVQAGLSGPGVPWPMRIGAAFDHAMPWLLFAWIAGVLFFVARLNLGLVAARRLRLSGESVSNELRELQELFDRLSARLGIRRAVQLLHSARVDVPTVIGWLRPVVLLPASCLSGLAPEQLEAILCHELAHIRRHDYLVGVLQSVVETLLFYHPAVWWVSKQVRRERECCCDEIAVSAGGDVLTYARALSYLEEQRSYTPQLALGANGGVLKMRIRRLLGHPEGSATSQAASIALLSVIAITTLAFAGRLAYAELRAAQTVPTTAEPAQAVTQAAASPASISDAQMPATGDRTRNGSDAAQQAQYERDASAQRHDEQLRAEQLRQQVDTLAKQYSDLARQYGDSPNLKVEDRRRLAYAQSQLDQAARQYDELLSRQLQATAEAAMAKAQSASLQDELRIAQVAMARINTPEFRKQMEATQSAMAKANAADLGKQLEAAQAAMAKINTPEFKRQMAAAMASAQRMNTPEMRKQLEDAMMAARLLESTELRAQMEQHAAQARLYAQETTPPMPASPPSSAPTSVSAGVIQQNLLTHPVPVYPPIAKAAHVQGVVVLHALISKDGKVEDLRVISGAPMLTAAAIDAVKQWTYKPYVMAGQPVEVETTINVNFTLGGDASAPVPPDMSCTYYSPKNQAHAGTCEEGSADKGNYYCRADDDKGLVQGQSSCEWKVKRMRDWQQNNLSPTTIQTSAP